MNEIHKIHKSPAKDIIILTESTLNQLLKEYISNSYTCSSCNKIIYPEVSIANNEFEFNINKSTINGGIGSKILKDNICDRCAGIFHNCLSE